MKKIEPRGHQVPGTSWSEVRCFKGKNNLLFINILLTGNNEKFRSIWNYVRFRMRKGRYVRFKIRRLLKIMKGKWSARALHLPNDSHPLKPAVERRLVKLRY
jgi:hypothetical protein